MRAMELIGRHRAQWETAVQHPFLDGIRDGSLPPDAFRTWLVQDYLYVRDLLVFQARLLARAPRLAQPILIGGLAALEAELGWFETHAQRLQLDLNTARHPTTAAYRDYLLGQEQGSYTPAIVALWALEQVYLESWRHAAPGSGEYREFVEHWTVPAFETYVAGLEQAADASLADGDAEQESEAAFLEVVRLERDFWDMAFSRGGQA